MPCVSTCSNETLIEERRAVLAKLVEGLCLVFPGQDRPGRSDDAAPLSPSLSAGLRRVTVRTSRLRPARRPAASLLSQREFELVDTLNPDLLSRLRNLLILGDKRDPVAPEAVCLRFAQRVRNATVRTWTARLKIDKEERHGTKGTRQ
jgi:hypothetical protein